LRSQESRPATEAAERAREGAERLTEQAKRQVQSMFAQQKGAAASTLGHVAHALRQAAQQLSKEEEGTVAGYTDRAADQLERFSNLLRTKDLRDVMDDTQNLARQRPELFFGGALAAGFLLARFLKASGQRASYRQGYPPHRTAYPGTGYAAAVVETPTGVERTSLGSSPQPPIREGV
jgi:hypothetical protein